MCNKLSNNNLEGEEKKKLSILRRPSLLKPLIIALVLVLILSTIPLLPQTRISVTTDLDTIKNVSVETPNVPLVVTLFPSPSIGKGAYTVKVEVFKDSELIFNSTREDVPSGDFTFVWINNGRPEAGNYTITAHLLRGTIEVDLYSLEVEF